MNCDSSLNFKYLNNLKIVQIMWFLDFIWPYKFIHARIKWKENSKISRGRNLNDGGEKKMSNGGKNMFKVQCIPTGKDV